MVENEGIHSIDFPGRDPSERFQFYFRQHWIRLLWPLLRTCLLTAFLLALGYGILFFAPSDDPTRRFSVLFLFCCLLAVQGEFLLRFYRHFLYITIVTDRRVHRIKRSILALDERQSIDLWVLQDIRSFQRGLIQNMFGFGTLRLEAQDNHMRLHFTPGIRERYSDLMHLLERARLKMGPTTRNSLLAD